MDIITLVTGYMGSNIYLVIEKGHTVIIDPSCFELITDFVDNNELKIDFGILTHEHCDHTYGVGFLKDKFQCPIIASKICCERLMNPKSNYSAYYSAMMAISDNKDSIQKTIKPFSEQADITFSSDYEVTWQNHNFFLKETPGHTDGSVCILLDNKFLFSGDSLFGDQKTNLRFPTGSKTKYEKITIPWLRSLPKGTHVYPGHYKNFELHARLVRSLI